MIYIETFSITAKRFGGIEHLYIKAIKLFIKRTLSSHQLHIFELILERCFNKISRYEDRTGAYNDLRCFNTLYEIND